MNNCKTCRYALYDPKWTEYKCALKQFDIPNPPEEFGCKSHQPGRPRRALPPWKEPRLGSPGDKILVENGTFYASGDGMTGYRSVTVKVPAGKDAVLQDKTVTQNGTVKPDKGYDGLSSVVVKIPDPVLQDKVATENGTVTPDKGYDGLSSVVIQIPDPILQDKTVSQNGLVEPDEGYDGLSSVTVDIPDPILQERVIDISENGTYTIVADASYDGLIKVIINVDIAHSGPSTTAVVGRAIVGYAIAGEG